MSVNKKKALNILIADDSKTICKYIASAIKNMPIKNNIVQVHDGAKCLALLQSEKCDIAFVDINMPEMDGLEALKMSRKNGGDAFVVMMSTEVNDEKRQQARESDAYEYLQKPIKPKDLTDIINNYTRFQTKSDILIVDDSRTVRNVVKRILADSVFKMDIREAGSAKEAISECKFEVPDVLFLDINMPETNGIEALKQMIEQEAAPKTILMTGDKSIEFDKSMLELGVVSLLYKPFYAEDVDRIIHEIFDLRPTSLQHMEKPITLQAKEILK